MDENWTSHNLRIAGETIQDHTDDMIGGDVFLDGDASLRVIAHMEAADEEIVGWKSEVETQAATIARQQADLDAAREALDGMVDTARAFLSNSGVGQAPAAALLWGAIEQADAALERLAQQEETDAM